MPYRYRINKSSLSSLIGIACYCTFLFLMTSCTKPLTENEQMGRVLYDVNCSECHDIDQSGLIKKPPNLHNLFSRNTLPDGITPATDAAVRQVIINGKRTMPAFNGRLSEEQVTELLAYLHRK